MTVELDLDESIDWQIPLNEPIGNWNGRDVFLLQDSAYLITIPEGDLNTNSLLQNREIIELLSQGEEVQERSRCEKGLSLKGAKKFWKKHKKVIIITTVVVAAVAVTVIIVVATSGGAAVASAAAGAAGAASAAEKEKKPPEKKEPSPAKDMGSHIAHQAWDGVTEIVSVIPQLCEEIRDLNGTRLPDGTIVFSDGSTIENYERLVAAGHEAIDRLFDTNEAMRYTPDIKTIEKELDQTALVLPPPSSISKTGSSIKDAARSGQKTVSAAEQLAHNQAMCESKAKFKSAEAFLKRYRDQPLSEAQIRHLIHQTGMKTFPRPAGIPENFRVKISDNGAGMLYVHPEHNHTSIRIMPGKPHSMNESQRNPYVIHKRDGNCVDKFGNIVDSSSPEAHIPISDFKYTGNW